LGGWGLGVRCGDTQLNTWIVTGEVVGQVGEVDLIFHGDIHMKNRFIGMEGKLVAIINARSFVLSSILLIPVFLHQSEEILTYV